MTVLSYRPVSFNVCVRFPIESSIADTIAEIKQENRVKYLHLLCIKKQQDIKSVKMDV